MHDDLQKHIRDRAYEIWEEEGRPEGRSEEHWRQAEVEFAEARAPAPDSAPKRKTVKPAAKGGARKTAAKTGKAATAAKKAAPKKAAAKKTEKPG